MLGAPREIAFLSVLNMIRSSWGIVVPRRCVVKVKREDLQDATKACTHYQLATRAGIREVANNLAHFNLLDNKGTIIIPMLLRLLQNQKKLLVKTHYALLEKPWLGLFSTE